MSRAEIEKSIDEFLFRCYGLRGSLSRLAGQNLNYLVSTSGGARFVLKIVDEGTPPDRVELERALVERLRRAGFEARLPGILISYNKKIETRIKIPINGVYSARLMDFVPGCSLEGEYDISVEMLFSIGKTLGALDRVLEGWDHPVAHRGHAWELAAAGQHRDKLGLIADAALRQRVSWAFDLWDAVRVRLSELPWQVIHGDANLENILVEQGRVSGLVDLGDACYNPRICELAICLAYAMMNRRDPLEAAAAVIAGYVQEVDLLEDELAVLFPLVCGRLAVSICLAMANRSRDPDNANLFVSLAPAQALLSNLQEIGVSHLAR